MRDRIRSILNESFEVEPSLESIIEKIHGGLSQDLLKPEYRGRSSNLFGHCYVATEALYYLWGRDRGYQPYNVRHEGSPHWFLKNEETGDIVDPTAEQFETPVPYEKGRRNLGFYVQLGFKPSKRTQILLNRIK